MVQAAYGQEGAYVIECMPGKEPGWGKRDESASIVQWTCECTGTWRVPLKGTPSLSFRQILATRRGKPRVSRSVKFSEIWNFI